MHFNHDHEQDSRIRFLSDSPRFDEIWLIDEAARFAEIGRLEPVGERWVAGAVRTGRMQQTPEFRADGSAHQKLCKCMDCYDAFTLAYMKACPEEDMSYVLSRWDCSRGIVHGSKVEF